MVLDALGMNRFLARIFKMPVQNRNSKNFAGLYLATQLLSILIPTTLNTLLCQNGQFTLPSWFLRQILGYSPKKSKKS